MEMEDYLYCLPAKDSVIKSVILFSIKENPPEAPMKLTEDMVDDDFINDWVREFKETFAGSLTGFFPDDAYYEIEEDALMKFCNDIRMGVVEVSFLKLANNGYAEYGYSEEKEDFVFWLTEEGKKLVTDGL